MNDGRSLFPELSESGRNLPTCVQAFSRLPRAGHESGIEFVEILLVFKPVNFIVAFVENRPKLSQSTRRQPLTDLI